MRGPEEKARPRLAHTGIGQDLHPIDGGAADPRREGTVSNATVILVVDRTELEGQLKGWVEKLLGEMQQQDIPSSGQRAGRSPGLLNRQFRGLIVSMIHKFEGIDKRRGTGQHLRLHRRGAPLGRQGTRHLSHGGGPQRHDHRLHRHADRPDRARSKARSKFSAPTTRRAISTSTRSASRSRTRRHCRSGTRWRRAR